MSYISKSIFVSTNSLSSTKFYLMFLLGTIISCYFNIFMGTIVFTGDYSSIMGKLFFWFIGLVLFRDDFISCKIFNEFSRMRLFFIF